MITPDQIRNILKAIIVPGPDQNLVELGYVHEIEVKENHISVNIEFPAPLGKVESEIKEQARDAIASIPGVPAYAKIEIKTAVVVRTNSKQKSTLPGVKNVIAVASGKGGVGKSTTAANLAAALAQSGAAVGILDADIYGPSIPLMFGLEGQLKANADNQLMPLKKHNISIVSVGLLNQKKAMIWRGPMVHQMVHAFLTQTAWGELDYLVIDLPPGTGDAHLTITQTAPITGAVVVSTPQEVALEDARKGIQMFHQVQVPILGLIETMSYFICDHCDTHHDIFKTGGTEALAKQLKINFIGKIPICKDVVITGDSGIPVVLSNPSSPAAIAYVESALKIANMLAKKSDNNNQFSMKW